MRAKYELIYHKELNMFNWHCAYFGLFHHCTRKINGTINIASCPNSCSFFEKELERKEYSSFRWKVNEDGYSICGTCFDKLSDRPICENCFYASCYSSIDEKCAWFNLLEKKSLPIEVLPLVFEYLRDLDLIEVSEVWKEWNYAVKTARFISKLKETNGIFTDKIWLLKSYKKHFQSFQYDVYWEILNVLKNEKVFVLEKEIFGSTFSCLVSYVVLLYITIWSRHLSVLYKATN